MTKTFCSPLSCTSGAPPEAPDSSARAGLITINWLHDIPSAIAHIAQCLLCIWLLHMREGWKSL